MSTLALYDLFARPSTSVGGSTSLSGHLWADGATTNDAIALTIDSGGKVVNANASTSQAGTAWSAFTPPAADYGAQVSFNLQGVSSTALEAGVLIRGTNSGTRW